MCYSTYNPVLLTRIWCGMLCNIHCTVSLACCSTKTLVTRCSWRTFMNVSHGCQAPTGHQPPYHGLMSYVRCSVSGSSMASSFRLCFWVQVSLFRPFQLLPPLSSALYIPSVSRSGLPQIRLRVRGRAVRSPSWVRVDPRPKTFLANVNSRSPFAVARPSVCRL